GFIDRVRTTDVSREGAQLSDVKRKLKPGDLVVVRCEENTGRFQVKWVETQSPESFRIGLARVRSNRAEDAGPVLADEPDDYMQREIEGGGKSPRGKCAVAVDLRLKNMQVPMWATSVTRGGGGCGVETPIAVPAGSQLNIALWVNNVKAWAQA